MDVDEVGGGVGFVRIFFIVEYRSVSFILL